MQTILFTSRIEIERRQELGRLRGKIALITGVALELDGPQQFSLLKRGPRWLLIAVVLGVVKRQSE